jgi:hypothetical protein
MLSLVLPDLTNFFYPSGVIGLWFWVFLGIGAILLCLSIYLGFKHSGWAYVTAIASGIVFGILFAVAMMSVLIF